MFDRFINHPSFGCGSKHPQKWWRALGKALLSENYLKEKQMAKGSFGASVGKAACYFFGEYIIRMYSVVSCAASA